MSQIGTYEILRSLGKVGVVEQFLARQVFPDGTAREVVIRRLLAQYTRQVELVSRFLTEARIVSRLDHPNICRIVDVGASGKDYFYATAHVQGWNLDEVQSACQARGYFVPPLLVTHLLSCICAALHHAHSESNESGEALGIVNRDLCPTNILLTLRGQVQVQDFGLVKAGLEARKGVPKATVAYMSPEQCRGEATDARSDVFSAGVLLYELCCHRRLFRRTTEFASVRAILEDPIPPPSAVSDEVPDALEMIILRALARSPEYRYDSALEMGQALAEAARENGWVIGPGDLAAFMAGLYPEGGVGPLVAVPSDAELIPAEPDEVTRLETPPGLELLRTPGGTVKGAKLSEPRPTPTPLDFWSATESKVPAPLPALDPEMQDAPEAGTMPMALSGELDLIGQDDDAKTLVRMHTPVPEHVVISADQLPPPEDPLVFEVEEGEDEDPDPPVVADPRLKQSGVWGRSGGLELYADIPEASQPAVQRAPTSRQSSQPYRQTLRVQTVSNVPVGRPSWQIVLGVAAVSLVVGGGLLAILLWTSGGKKLGQVTLSSDPQGATVALDGRERFGTTPLTISEIILDQPHELVLLKDDHAPWRKKFTLTRAQPSATFAAALQARQIKGEASLVIKTQLPGARVFLDGEMRGKTPLVIEGVSCTKVHELVVKREGYADLVRKIKGLKPGQRLRLELQLEGDTAEREKGVKAPGSGARRSKEDDAPVIIPQTRAPLRRLNDDRVGSALPRAKKSIK